MGHNDRTYTYRQKSALALPLKKGNTVPQG